jgi:uncharacterized protein (TIGR02117 family)
MRRTDLKEFTLPICFALSLSLLRSAGALAADWGCAPGEASCKTVYLVHNSWHAAIVLSHDDLNLQLLPELKEFPPAKFVEFSWGDQDYFPDPNSGIWAALRAGFWSSGSVVHLVAAHANPREFYPSAEIFELRLNSAAQRELIRYLSDSFARPGAGPAPARPGLFNYSRFYPSNQRFSVLRTCNTWVAEALAAAGLPLTPGNVFTAGNLASQVAPLATANQRQ